MARDEVVFRVSADEAKALSAFQKLIDKQDQVQKSTQRGTQSVRQQASAVDNWGASLAKGLAAGVGFASMNQALQTGVGLLRQYDQYLGSIADKNERVAGAAHRAFVALQTPGEAGQRFVMESYRAGAGMGLMPEQTAAIMQPLQSVSADQQEAMGRFLSAAQLVQLGVDAEAAKQIEVVGAGRGLAPGLASDITVKAASFSALGERPFASAAAATAAFSGFDVGMAGATALTRGGITAEGLRESVQAAGRVLGLAGDVTPFAEKYGLAGQTEAEKLATLRQHAITTGDQSLSESERVRMFSQTLGTDMAQIEARAVGIMMNQFDSFVETLTAISGEGAVGTTSGKISTLMEDPVTATQLRVEASRATSEVGRVYGPEGDAARERELRLRARGADLQSRGLGFLTDEEGKAGRIIQFIDSMIEGAQRQTAYSQYQTGRNAESIKPTTQALEDNTRAVERLADTIVDLPRPLNTSRNGGNE